MIKIFLIYFTLFFLAFPLHRCFRVPSAPRAIFCRCRRWYSSFSSFYLRWFLLPRRFNAQYAKIRFFIFTYAIPSSPPITGFCSFFCLPSCWCFCLFFKDIISARHFFSAFCHAFARDVLFIRFLRWHISFLFLLFAMIPPYRWWYIFRLPVISVALPIFFCQEMRGCLRRHIRCRTRRDNFWEFPHIFSRSCFKIYRCRHSFLLPYIFAATALFDAAARRFLHFMMPHAFFASFFASLLCHIS